MSSLAHLVGDVDWIKIPPSLIVIASYPHSGSSLLRELLESSTGIFTGSLYNEKSDPTRWPGDDLFDRSQVVFVDSNFPLFKR